MLLLQQIPAQSTSEYHQLLLQLLQRRQQQQHVRTDLYAHIKHHSEVGHLSYEERDVLGFLGEFACCELLGINWKDNIRENYLTIHLLRTKQNLPMF